MILTIGVGLLSIAILLIASFVIARSSNSQVNKFFAYFSLATGLWMPANYIGANYKDHYISTYFIHADFFLGSILALLLWLFTLGLLSEAKYKSNFVHTQCRLKVWMCLFAVLVGLSTFMPQIVKVVFEGGSTTITYQKYFIVYSVGMLILLGFAVVNMVLALRKAKGELKRQVTTMIAGLAFAVGVLSIPNLLLPIITDSKSLNLLLGNLSYFAIAIFIFATFYSIVRHKLFDLRLLLARTIAYTLSLLTFTLVYVLSATLISVNLIDNYTPSTKQLAINTLLVFLLVFTINPVRRFFDRLTSSLFYRDAYDAQILLDELNKVLVSTYEMSPLLKNSDRILFENIKPTYSLFEISETATTTSRIVGSDSYPNPSTDDLKTIKSGVLKVETKVILTDNLDDNHVALKKILRKYDIAVLARLTSAVDEDGVGYLMLGPKKSGNIYSKQDLRMLEIITNELVIAIQNSLRVEEIAQFNVTLQAKVNEATKKLQKTNEKLKALDETKDDFISMASHQLRTPLTSVKGYISMVLEEDAGKITPMQKEMLGQAFFSSQRMVYLIADLLNVSRLKTGKFIIDPAPVNLSRVIEEELIQLKETAAARQLKLEFIKPKSFPDLMLDETKIRQVIMNFVDNAIYYTPAGGKIKVRLIDEPRNIELRVEDTGLGVPKSEQPHLFTKFYRAGNARKARPDGTGLGLFMAKKVIVAQGGSTIFESQEGKGSTFGFVFNKKHLNDMAAEIKNTHATTTSTTRDQK